MQVPISKTILTESEIQSVLEPLQSGWLVQGPKVREFEEKWSAFTGIENSIAVTSCTSALHLSLAALGFGPGDEAIVPAFTWISTANVVEHLGGKVVFCDIDLETFNIDVNDLNEKISDKTRAILPVHLFGLPADMAAIMQLAREKNIFVVEDAACGFGSTFNQRHVGGLGDTGCFSFHPRKAITTGEGGMVTTHNSELAVKIRRLRDHGASITDLQRHHGPRPYLLADHPEAGFNQRMTDIQAALGSAQMSRANEILTERRSRARTYSEALASLDFLYPTEVSGNKEHSYQSFPCVFRPELVLEAINSRSVAAIKSVNNERNKFMDYLQGLGISTRPATHAVHMLEYYSRKYCLNPEDFFKAFAANDCSISLPLYSGMTDEEQDYVIDAVRGYQR